MQAVILAAGQGQRIREHHTLPKGFIEINHKPLIRHSLDILKEYGFDDILVVTGYASAYYEDLKSETDAFETIYNPYYATYGNLYSLYLSHNWVSDDVLILESDIIYEPRAISILMAQAAKDTILVSGPTGSNDEVYVEVDAKQNLTQMRKILSELDKPYVLGEFVGLSRLELATFKQYMNYLENNQALLQQGNYDEDGFGALAKQCSLHCELVSDLLWSEIDNVDQYDFAKKLYPKMNQEIEMQHV
ncbi:MAG: hypothetical protein COB66_00565 [Coxiella sp. (in: Bacteria)]|nr:MAG: hypothetical protein COB66_00565 [Coxiella sp. (in: g-proteobacteria)]